MPGVPKSKGCNTCRKQKKLCDEAQPKCGRCVRLKTECVGIGVRRFLFKQDALTRYAAPARSTTSPRPAPSSETTRIAGALVHILEIRDIRHDIRSIGGKYFLDLPRRVGHLAAAYDASVAALVASYSALYGRGGGRTASLMRYGDALAATRVALPEGGIPTVVKMYMVFNIYVCQEWTCDTDPVRSSKHREMLAFLLREVVARGELPQIDTNYIYALCQMVVYESFVNEKVELGPWFWEAYGVVRHTGPYPYHYGKTFLSIRLETYAEASLYFRSPRRNLPQLTQIHNLIQAERPALWAEVEAWTATCRDPSAPDAAHRALLSYQTAYGLLLSIGARVIRAIRRVNPDIDLLLQSYNLCDDAIRLARQSEAGHRPFGAWFVPKFLRLVRAGVPGYRRGEVDALMRDFAQDFKGIDYIKESEWVEGRYNAMEDMVSGQ
ncbi:uncharacterized protein B0H64DRAFT_48207 [Chaetomium fimeti]|uniref:Zn(2)-C6 fungal-type domain-containing protein n=1 Tax=Chaetomium fimeti TaxID=1854472 RepID=A0AAE0H6N9_9PEZI|nr:hypothetical protein B0H64DRAFT_48207 [Chaetomium fimeti]